MPTATLSIVFSRTPAEVNALFGDLEKTPLWNTMVLEAKQTKGDVPAVGAEFLYKTVFLGKQIEIPYVATEYEQDKKLVIKTATPFPQEYMWTFESIPEGTRLTFTMTVEPGGYYKLATPLIEAMALRAWKTSLENLKGLLEAPVATTV